MSGVRFSHRPPMEEKIQNLEKEVEIIKQRNAKVEADKGWEVSWTRRLFIAISTYIIAGIWLVVIHDTFPFLKAFVPMVGYLLSTLSLPFIKRWWINNNYKKTKMKILTKKNFLIVGLVLSIEGAMGFIVGNGTMIGPSVVLGLGILSLIYASTKKTVEKK